MKGGDRRLTAAVLAWAVLHVYTSVTTFFENWYYTYTVRSWLTLGIWLLGLLVLDVWLRSSGGAELLRSLKWYWGLSILPFVVTLLGALRGAAVYPDRGVLGFAASVLFVIAMFLAPVNQCLAFAWLLSRGLAGLSRSALDLAGWSAGLLFCLAHFIYTARLHRRAKTGGGTADGPVGPGTGTVG